MEMATASQEAPGGGTDVFLSSQEQFDGEAVRRAGGGGGGGGEVSGGEGEEVELGVWTSDFLLERSHSPSPRSRQSGSPRATSFASSGSTTPTIATSFPSGSRMASPLRSPYASATYGFANWWHQFSFLGFSLSDLPLPRVQKPWQRLKKQKGENARKPGVVVSIWQQLQLRRRRTRGVVVAIGVVVTFFFLVNWWIFSHLQDASAARLYRGNSNALSNRTLPSSPPSILGGWSRFQKDKRPQRLMFARLLALAAHALAEGNNKREPPELWEEPLSPDASWTPCADQRSWETCEGNNGYILVSANGGINQQRVAICNAVAISRLLNSTLVVPHFLYSSVWRDKSQFSDIYQEEHFINYLKDDIRIVKELPVELRSLDLKAIGSEVEDAEVMKEAKPKFFLKKILPILLQNRVVHFIGFGNRLAFDPIPFELQRLRCRCNFHALQFITKIQETGALLVQRMRNNRSHWGPLDQNLIGRFAEESNMKAKKDYPNKASRYLAVHLRFEIDMAAYSLCYFGGGKEEEEELEAYRAIHFPALTNLKNTTKIPSAAVLRSEGQCPLTPEEAVLMLAALGFKRRTHIYVAGASIYGGKARMAALTSLFPYLATKESLLSSSEIGPFINYSSQLAALDFIVCAAADAFTMTDSGSQLSSLVSGFRMYYGGGKHRPTIRPNKRRLANIFSKNSTIEWRVFAQRVRKAVRQTKKAHERPVARSVYRHPRCRECMCRTESR